MGWGGQAGKMVGDHLLFCTRLHNRVLVDSKLHLMSENQGSIISKTIAGGCSGIWEHNGVIGFYLRKCLDKTSFNKGFRKIIKSVENTIQFYDAKTLKPKQKIQLGITEATDDDMLRYTEGCIIKKYDSLQWGWAVFASDKNQIVISQGSNRMLEVLDGGTGERLRASESYDTCITMIAVSPDESEIAVALLDQIIILDFETLKVKSSIPFSGDFSQSTSQEEVVYMEYISDDSLLIFGRSEEEINYETVLKKRVILCKDPASKIPSFRFAGQKFVRMR
jgi:WD40 repeat protein